jgi:uncharacterized protein (UPF0335 family)
MTNTTQNVTADELRAMVERIEHLNARISNETEARADIYVEAKLRGYCTKTIRIIVAMRKKRADVLAEEDAIEELYRQALTNGLG